MADSKETKKERRNRKRVHLIELLGGKCVDCGRTEELDFHHLDPATKSFNIGGNFDRSLAALVAEAAKCVLLCPPCHDVRHAIEKLQASYADRPVPTPNDLRAAAARRLTGSNRAARSMLGGSTAPRRKSITRSVADGEPVESWSTSTTSYSPSNIATGQPLGPNYTQVSLKLPGDSPLAADLAAAVASGDWPSLSAVARDWLGVGAAEWRTLTSTNTTTEGNTTT